MNLHIITVGEPKLAYARQGWGEYTGRLGRYHSLHTTHLHDKYAHDATHLLHQAKNGYLIVLAVQGTPLSTPELADFLERQAALFYDWRARGAARYGHRQGGRYLES
ncbi:MAG TPA: 23S rRNA (pseudouridine(1915)-N(3))-methyltransferase RlmH [Candidatus Saccharimonadales bacterium]|nr:23S rRNA (pseudouridine(1915)-N(3))-methyltransferase RlmH [Candidatus Saccharimonadales bacterium]